MTKTNIYFTSQKILSYVGEPRKINNNLEYKCC